MNYDMNRTKSLVLKIEESIGKALLEEFSESSLSLVEESLAELSASSMLGSFYAGQLRTILTTKSSKEYLDGYLKAMEEALNFDDGFSL